MVCLVATWGCSFHKRPINTRETIHRSFPLLLLQLSFFIFLLLYVLQPFLSLSLLPLLTFPSTILLFLSLSLFPSIYPVCLHPSTLRLSESMFSLHSSFYVTCLSFRFIFQWHKHHLIRMKPDEETRLLVTSENCQDSWEFCKPIITEICCLLFLSIFEIQYDTPNSYRTVKEFFLKSIVCK